VVAEIFPVEVPPVCEKTTGVPPLVRLFPAASRAIKVRVRLFPLATVAAEAVTRDCVKDRGPGVTVTVGIAEDTGVPPMVAVIVVGVPEITPVKVAV
jgi:hypothetical protein